MYKIILASQSPRRRDIMQQVGIRFDCIPSEMEETITGSNPEEIVRSLSGGKAEDVAKNIDFPAVIIGADTVVAFEGRIMGKPLDKKEACMMLQLLQGKTHQVFTGITVIIKDEEDNRRIHFAERTDVEIYPVSREQIEQYVATGEPMDKAGAYAIQGLFAKYVKKIEGDYNNVVGLPVARIFQELLKKGIDITLS